MYDFETAKEMVGQGWWKLLEILYWYKPTDTVVLQVKEKYAGLRFYVGGTTKQFLDLIALAEFASLHMCEDCGKEGSPKQINGWSKTLCNDCYKGKPIKEGENH